MEQRTATQNIPPFRARLKHFSASCWITHSHGVGDSSDRDPEDRSIVNGGAILAEEPVRSGRLRVCWDLRLASEAVCRNAEYGQDISYSMLSSSDKKAHVAGDEFWWEPVTEGNAARYRWEVSACA